VATWDDVVQGVVDLPEVAPSTAHEGSPAFEVRHRQFLRQRVEDERTILQFWVRDTGVQDSFVQPEPDIFWVHHRFGTPATMAWLDMMDRETLREVLVESWSARAPKRLVQAHPNLK
jgi:hypothetical protein